MPSRVVQARGQPAVTKRITRHDPLYTYHKIGLLGKRIWRLTLGPREGLPKLRFEVVPVALLVEQVQELGLPSTPLKATEKRADRWRQAFGVEQTEIDALATLRPNVLREIIERAFDPYWDSTLVDRVNPAETEWLASAQAAINAQIDPEVLTALRTEATNRLTELASMIADINERLRLAADRFELPMIEVPTPEIDEDAVRHALVSLDDSWVEATRALLERKSYGNGNGRCD